MGIDVPMSEVPDGSVVLIGVRKDGINSGVLSFTMVQPTDLSEIGTTDIDLATGEMTGAIADVPSVIVRLVTSAFVPGDLIRNPGGAIHVVRAMGAGNVYAFASPNNGDPMATGDCVRVGHVDLGTLDLDD